MNKRLLLFMCLALFAITMQAQIGSVTIDNIVYTVYDYRAEVSGYEGSPTDVVIESSVEYDGTAYPVTSIRDHSLRSCPTMTSVVIPSSVTSIYSYAFNGNYNLASITFNEGLELIDYYAFGGCTSLTSITLPSTLKEIRSGAFASCMNLMDITCLATTPPTATNIFVPIEVYQSATLTVPEGSEDAYRTATGWTDFYAYKTHGGLKYKLDFNNTTAAVVGYEGEPMTTLDIPQTIDVDGNSYTVTSINEQAFVSCQLTSLTLPSTINYIGSSAFYGSRLTSLTLPSAITTIAYGAFYNSQLTSLTLPENMVEIGSAAFYNSPLTSLTCLATTPPIVNDEAFYNADLSREKLTLPEGSEKAYRGADWWKYFYLFTVDGLQYIFNSGGETVAVDWFTGEPVNVVIPETVAYGDETLTVTAINNSSFEDCATLESITIPATVTYIGYAAFAGSPVTSVTCLGATPPAAESSAFDPYTYSGTLNVPAGAEEAYSTAEVWQNFDMYTNIGGIVYQRIGDTENAMVCGASPTLVDANIPEKVVLDGVELTVTTIGEGAFYGHEHLETVVLPATITEIGDGAFAVDNILKSFTCNATTIPTISDYGYNAYAACAELIVPAEAEEAYRNDEYWSYFYYYAAADGIIYSYDSYGNGYVYWGDARITEANIRETINIDGADYTVRYIDYIAFENFYNLKTVNIPSSIVEIGYGAFMNCYNLESITLPASVQYVRELIFNGCSSLKDIYCLAVTPPQIYYSYYDYLCGEYTYGNATLHVLPESLEAYKVADGWKYFTNIAADLTPTAIGAPVSETIGASYVNDELTIDGNATISVYSQTGTQMMRVSNANALSLRQLPRGVYIVRIESDGKQKVMKLTR